MNTLDKIVFIADYIEPKRDKAANLKEIRKTAFEDLDEALKRFYVILFIISMAVKMIKISIQ